MRTARGRNVIGSRSRLAHAQMPERAGEAPLAFGNPAKPVSELRWSAAFLSAIEAGSMSLQC
jgi:hypothetical protein